MRRTNRENGLSAGGQEHQRVQPVQHKKPLEDPIHEWACANLRLVSPFLGRPRPGTHLRRAAMTVADSAGGPGTIASGPPGCDPDVPRRTQAGGVGGVSGTTVGTLC